MPTRLEPNEDVPLSTKNVFPPALAAVVPTDRTPNAPAVLEASKPVAVKIVLSRSVPIATILELIF